MQTIEKIIEHYLENQITNFKTLSFKNFSNQFIKVIRKKYGKTSSKPKSSKIGTHPDYKDSINVVKNGHVITFFADISGSTKLSANLPPTTVLIIKKTVISIFSQVVIALDGHVHRLQGDAIMAFFNWKDMKHSQSIWNAIFAAMEILRIIKNVLAKFIAKEIKKYKKINNSISIADNIAVRIGIDYGSRDATLWAKLGVCNNIFYTKIYEHTASGVNVDLACKIQNTIGRNQIGLGENAYKKIHLDSCYLDIHIKKGKKIPFILNKPRYSYRILKSNKLWNDIFDCVENKGQIKLLANNNNIFPLSTVLDKNITLYYHHQNKAENDFKIITNLNQTKIEWWVNNTGSESNKSKFLMTKFSNKYYCQQITKYNGLHFMILKQKDKKLKIKYPLIINDDKIKIRDLWVPARIK